MFIIKSDIKISFTLLRKGKWDHLQCVQLQVEKQNLKFINLLAK